MPNVTQGVLSLMLLRFPHAKVSLFNGKPKATVQFPLFNGKPKATVFLVRQRLRLPLNEENCVDGRSTANRRRQCVIEKVDRTP
jgi:hypothetical protein